MKCGSLNTSCSIRAEYLRPALQGHRLQAGQYERIKRLAGRLPSIELGLHLEQHDRQLRFWDPTTCRWLPSPQEAWEAAEAERQQAELERQQAEAKWRQAMRRSRAVTPGIGVAAGKEVNHFRMPQFPCWDQQRLATGERHGGSRRFRMPPAAYAVPLTTHARGFEDALRCRRGIGVRHLAPLASQPQEQSQDRHGDNAP